MFLSSFCINIQRYSSIGRRSIKIVRGSGSGTIFSTLFQSNLNSRSSNIDKTWGKSYSTQIMNFGKKKNLVSVYKKKFFLQKIAIKILLFLKLFDFFEVHHHLRRLSMIDFSFHWKISIHSEDSIFNIMGILLTVFKK